MVPLRGFRLIKSAPLSVPISRVVRPFEIVVVKSLKRGIERKHASKFYLRRVKIFLKRSECLRYLLGLAFNSPRLISIVTMTMWKIYKFACYSGRDVRGPRAAMDQLNVISACDTFSYRPSPIPSKNETSPFTWIGALWTTAFIPFKSAFDAPE